MDQLQLTRYATGQLYNWHMDLGAGAMSRRKISLVVELAAGGYDGGGIEVFYGEGTGNRIALGQGDALVFPSFIMHRALPVQSGTRWTLVSWLNGRARRCNEHPEAANRLSRSIRELIRAVFVLSLFRGSQDSEVGCRELGHYSGI